MSPDELAKDPHWWTRIEVQQNFGLFRMVAQKRLHLMAPEPLPRSKSPEGFNAGKFSSFTPWSQSWTR